MRGDFLQTLCIQMRKRLTRLILPDCMRFVYGLWSVETIR